MQNIDLIKLISKELSEYVPFTRFYVDQSRVQPNTIEIKWKVDLALKRIEGILVKALQTKKNEISSNVLDVSVKMMQEAKKNVVKTTTIKELLEV